MEDVARKMQRMCGTNSTAIRKNIKCCNSTFHIPSIVCMYVYFQHDVWNSESGASDSVKDTFSHHIQNPIQKIHMK